MPPLAERKPSRRTPLPPRRMQPHGEVIFLHPCALLCPQNSKHGIFSTRRGQLAQPKNPKRSGKSIERRASPPNTSALRLSRRWDFARTTTRLRCSSLADRHRSWTGVPVVKERGGSSARSPTAPSNSVGAVMEWPDEWGNLGLPAAGPVAGGSRKRCQSV
ncbi:hypothetical protein EYF80_014420 [Liparis tanakae]|uniref:Uncharacterized protein n=1 Tax=Liparis tanakae TaxID=230148 RepID=A0A4Z2IEC4_9TELE|nr:hypothetical protein EYF80_014420 [Liparis tanakae]